MEPRRGSRPATSTSFPSTSSFRREPRLSSRPAVAPRPAAYAMLSVGLHCRSILEAETWSMNAALHILRRRESETSSVFAERPLPASADRHVAKYLYPHWDGCFQ